MDPLAAFSAPTRRWFTATFPAPTDAQRRGWPAIGAGDHTLIHAPTGSGKTLAAFLWAIDQLTDRPIPPARERCRVLYVSPLKALAYDIDRNLGRPLAGIARAAVDLGREPAPITTAMRTGDTPAAERRAMLRHPPDILITTPESLYLMLTSRAAEILRPVSTVIVDEIHAVAGTKRGTHLALSLERLEEIADTSPQRIGLSATQRPLADIARFLGGADIVDGRRVERDVTIIDAAAPGDLEIDIVVPVTDMTAPAADHAHDPDQPPPIRSIWPSIYPRIVEDIRTHRSTIVFVNSRGLAERLAAAINELAGEQLVRSHHGSVSRTERLEIEAALKDGTLRGVVATSTLELGIDMETVDLVVLVGTPPSVASALQRVGRSGHRIGAPRRAKLYPKHRGDLLEATVVAERMRHHAIEPTRIPDNALDVLAQQIVAATATRTWPVDELYDLARRSFPYRNLTRTVFTSVLDMLSGRYPSDDFAQLRPRIVWDRTTDTLEGRRGARLLAVTNPGTIPDRGLYTVVLPDGTRVGELDEEMVYESRSGDAFVLGSSTWRIDQITRDRVVVTPAPAGSSTRMPFWHGDGPGRPIELGEAIGAFLREIASSEDPEGALLERYGLDDVAAANLGTFIADQRAAAGAVPDDRTIVVERFRDEIGDWRIAVLSPFGARVHIPWALAVRGRYRDLFDVDADLVWSDDGMMFRFPDQDRPPDFGPIAIDPDEIEDLVVREIADSALFTSRFREAAARALLLPRRRPGARTPLWLQRRKAANLLQVTRRYGSFPIVLETYREILEDDLDVSALAGVLRAIQERRTRLVATDVTRPGPFTTALLLDFVASFMYDYDAPVAEKRAVALTLDRSLLAELLGQPEFHDLLDVDSITSVEQELQHLDPPRRARSADALHDLLRDLGPLEPDAAAARCDPGDAFAGWIDELRRTHRIIHVTVGGRERIAAVEDAARLRDGLGVPIPAGVPEAFLEAVPDPLGDLVARFGRTHGPFGTADAAAHLGLAPAVADEVLRRLADTGRVVAGGVSGGDAEWIDGDVLRRIRRRALARLRAEVEAVEPARYMSFLAAWQGIGGGPGPGRLREVLRGLQGAEIPAGVLERDVLAARVDYDPSELDELLGSGEVLWTGRRPIGRKDGYVSLYDRSGFPLLRPPVVPFDGTDTHERLREHLRSRGASFFPELYAAAGGGDPEAVADALWDLVWAGEVTNDSLRPLRAYLWGSATARRRPQVVSSPARAAGRWSLLDTTSAASPEERAAAIAEHLLDRLGVVTRPGVAAAATSAGFSDLAPVFRTMEELGTVRRGYFVDGLGGSQFARPGAVDRLRSVDPMRPTILAATDPAVVYGNVVPWPDHAGGTPRRRSGAHVVLVAGAPVVWADAGGGTIVTFTDDTEPITIAMRLLSRRHRPLQITSIDAVAVAAHPLAATLRSIGFVPGYRGYVLDPKAPTDVR